MPDTPAYSMQGRAALHDDFVARGRHLRGKMASAAAHGDAKGDREARAAYAELCIERAIVTAVEKAPPLSEAQRARLRRLLTVAPSSDQASAPVPEHGTAA